jgi:hypothetical protein
VGNSVPTISNDEFLLAAFEKELKETWLAVWRPVYRDALVASAARLIDLDSAFLCPGWTDLDNANKRRRHFPLGKAIWDSCVDTLMKKPQREKVLEAFRGAGRRLPNATDLRKSLTTALPAILSKSITRAVADENPFPALWTELADRLAGELHANNCPVIRDPEWRLLNSLLLIGLLASCRLPSAALFGQLGNERVSGTHLRAK